MTVEFAITASPAEGGLLTTTKEVLLAMTEETLLCNDRGNATYHDTLITPSGQLCVIIFGLTPQITQTGGY